MNRKKIQLLAVSVALAALVLMGQSGITKAVWQAPKKGLTDTFLVGSNDFFSEGLELVAAEDSAMITQYYQWDGEKTFPLDPSGFNNPASAFNTLEVLYIISSNQENWREYWPRSIWEFRDGAVLLLMMLKRLLQTWNHGWELHLIFFTEQK
jgi:hypothetical protein